MSSFPPLEPSQDEVRLALARIEGRATAVDASSCGTIIANELGVPFRFPHVAQPDIA